MVHEKQALLLDMVLVSVYWDDLLISVCCRNFILYFLVLIIFIFLHLLLIEKEIFTIAEGSSHLG
jgi:hypothetical protein